MNATNVLERVPIHTDAYGVVRVAGTRVRLESSRGRVRDRRDSREIAQLYLTVPLVDVYSVITYYLRHKPDVETYLKEREALAGRVREEPSGDSGSGWLVSARAARRRFHSDASVDVRRLNRGEPIVGRPTWPGVSIA